MGVQLREHKMGVVQMSINPASVAANTTAEQTFALPGLKVGDWVMVNKPSLTAGLNIANARCSAADTLAITFGNHTAGAIDAGAENYLIYWIRPEALDTVVVSP